MNSLNYWSNFDSLKMYKSFYLLSKNKIVDMFLSITVLPIYYNL